MRVYIAFYLLTCLGLSACSPAEGSPAWCRRMMNQPQGGWTPHQAMVFTTKCSRELNN